MKRILALTIAVCLSHAALAQTDLRCIYNFAADSPAACVKVENWNTDNWGDNFLNTGLGITANPFGVGGGYLDYARNFNFWHNVPVLKDFSVQAEFNGRSFTGNFNALFGVSYTLPTSKNILRASVLYKTFSGGAMSLLPMQVTLLWRLYDVFGLRGLDFRGTVRGWGEVTQYWYGDANPKAADPGIITIVAEPQLWYAVGQFFGASRLSVGGEVELSYNWLGCSGFRVRPSAGLKLQF